MLECFRPRVAPNGGAFSEQRERNRDYFMCCQDKKFRHKKCRFVILALMNFGIQRILYVGERAPISRPKAPREGDEPRSSSTSLQALESDWLGAAGHHEDGQASANPRVLPVRDAGSHRTAAPHDRLNRQIRSHGQRPHDQDHAGRIARRPRGYGWAYEFWAHRTD